MDAAPSNFHHPRNAAASTSLHRSPPHLRQLNLKTPNRICSRMRRWEERGRTDDLKQEDSLRVTEFESGCLCTQNRSSDAVDSRRSTGIFPFFFSFSRIRFTRFFLHSFCFDWLQIFLSVGCLCLNVQCVENWRRLKMKEVNWVILN